MGMDYSGLWALLKGKGWSTYQIRKTGLISEWTLTAIRAGKPIGGVTLERLCKELECQPGDIMQYRKEGDADV